MYDDKLDGSNYYTLGVTTFSKVTLGITKTDIQNKRHLASRVIMQYVEFYIIKD
jgi:hypothetical protein